MAELQTAKDEEINEFWKANKDDIGQISVHITMPFRAANPVSTSPNRTQWLQLEFEILEKLKEHLSTKLKGKYTSKTERQFKKQQLSGSITTFTDIELIIENTRDLANNQMELLKILKESAGYFLKEIKVSREKGNAVFSYTSSGFVRVEFHFWPKKHFPVKEKEELVIKT